MYYVRFTALPEASSRLPYNRPRADFAEKNLQEMAKYRVFLKSRIPFHASPILTGHSFPMAPASQPTTPQVSPKAPGIRSGRAAAELRPVSLIPDYVATAEGSVLISIGHTRVLCNATIEQGVPPWLRNSGRGWVTAEYGMLPRATLTRTARESERGKISGRTHEIQRLIGRSLRAVVDMQILGERTVILDCDVLQADGGTRTAAITGACAALALALNRLVKAGTLKQSPLRQLVAATSVGIVDDEVLLDLAYEEDSQAEVDMNIVMTEDGGLVEVQATAERQAFPRTRMLEMMDYAEAGIRQLFEAQRVLLAQGNEGAS
jgi:ribonuclease PH